MRHAMFDNRTTRTLGFLAGLALAAGTALAQNNGIDWVTIGDPGNRGTLPHEMLYRPDLRIGGVDYEYRIARNKLTTYTTLSSPFGPTPPTMKARSTGGWPE